MSGAAPLDVSRTAAPVRSRRLPSGATALFGLGLVFLYLLFAARVMSTSTYDIYGAVLLGPLYFFGGVALLRWLIRTTGEDRWVLRIATLSLALKLVSGLLRYYTAVWFLGIGDAWSYHDWGTQLAAEFRTFTIGGPSYQAGLPDLIGTEFIRLLTGIVYTVIGSTRLGGYLTFAFMSFWGLYFFYRAFRIALPEGDHRRYALIVFLLPSILFWPSSIGKEAWMTAVLGLSCFGVAKILTATRGGYTLAALGVGGMTLVRPHVAAIFVAGLVVGMIFRRTSGGISGTGKKLVGLGLIAIASGVLMAQLQSFFDFQEGLDVAAVLEETSRRSTTGGSAYTPVVPTTPAQMPWSIITVLFRPFVFEAGGAAGLVTASEGVLMMVLVVVSLPRLVRLPRAIVSEPYVALALLFVVLFCFAFSSLGNFGILARQRTQVFPFLAVLLSLPIKPFLRTRTDVIAERRARILERSRP